MLSTHDHTSSLLKSLTDGHSTSLPNSPRVTVFIVKQHMIYFPVSLTDH